MQHKINNELDLQLIEIKGKKKKKTFTRIMTAQRQKSERRGFLLDGEWLDAIRGELLPRGVGRAGKLRLVVVVVVVAVVVALHGDHGSGGEVRRGAERCGEDDQSRIRGRGRRRSLKRVRSERDRVR